MTLEAVTAALVTLFDAALAVPVFDGETATGQKPPAYVIVGWSDDGEDSVVDLTPSAMGNRWFDEDATTECAAYSWAGNGTLAEHGAISAALVEDCIAALAADPTLGNVLVPPYAAYVSRAARIRNVEGEPIVKYRFTISYTNLIAS